MVFSNYFPLAHRFQALPLQGFSKIRDILQRTDSTDEMSFFCSDGDAVSNQKVSLDNEDGPFAAHDKRAGSHAPPQSPHSSTANVKHGMRRTYDTAPTLGKKLEVATKTAVDAVTTSAKGVVKVTQQSVEGVGMIAKDLAKPRLHTRATSPNIARIIT